VKGYGIGETNLLELSSCSRPFTASKERNEEHSPNLMASKTLPVALVFLFGSWGAVFAQNPQLQLKTSGQFPTVIFSAVKWNADPSYYSIAIDASGTATYVSAPRGLDKTGVRYTTEFHVTDRTRRITFNLSQRLNYFRGGYGELQSSPGKNNVCTLAYRYGSVNNQFTYSRSADPDVEELTSVFEELSQTFEYGRKLADLQLHNRRAVVPQLEVMTGKAERHALRDLPALVPILRNVESDTSMEVAARKQASALIKLAQNSGQATFP
jgi:hypothetical protein